MVVVAIAFSAVAFAKSIRLPESWTKNTDDGRAVFVMLLPKGDAERFDRKSDSLRQKYRRSGLYPVNGTIPYWTVAWFADKHNLVLSYTGEYVAAKFVRDDAYAALLTFYARGKFCCKWTAQELDPEQVWDLERRHNVESTSTDGTSRQFKLDMLRASISPDGRLEIPSRHGVTVFAIQTGALLSNVPNPSRNDAPCSERDYAEFCRVLGTTGTRNPNFVSGMPDDEWEWVEVPPVRPLPAKPRHIMPQAPRSAATPPLAADSTDWHLWLAVGTSLSFLACSSVLQLRKHSRRVRAFAAA